MTEFEKRPEDPLLPSLYFGVATAIYLASQVGIFLGYNIGDLLASRNFLDFVIPLIFMALLAPHLGGRDRQLAAVSSAIFSIILAPSLPLRSGLLVSMLIGITVGITYNTLTTKRDDNKRKKGENN
jgi:predicted branched-subunit amino acid permease